MTSPSSPRDPAPRWRLPLPHDRGLELVAGRPLVMGVVNITPDSFSDGGHHVAPDDAVAHGRRLLDEGADLLDLGAESTRPGGGVYGAGARDVPPDEEWDRLAPVLERLRALTDRPIAVDTRKGAVAAAALDAGADLINDVGGLTDPTLAQAVARAGCPVVVMHSRGSLGDMQRSIRFDDVVAEVADELAATAQVAASAGIDPRQLIYDPGIGFGKTPRQNLALIRDLAPLAALGRPVLIGASRKSFIDHVSSAPPDRRLGGSLAAAAWATRGGAAVLRVHDVHATVQFLRLWAAMDALEPVRGSN